jgi:hypothetical protein
LCQRRIGRVAADFQFDSAQDDVRMEEFTARTVAPEQVRTLFPLMREAVPELDLKTWLAFARRLTAGRRRERAGIVAVTRRGRNMPCGAFIYRCQRNLPGAELVAEHFVALDVLYPDAVMQALVAELDALAQRLGCASIRVLVAGDASLLQDGLEAAGLRPQAVALRKSVTEGLTTTESSRRRPASAENSARGASSTRPSRS